MATSHSPRRMTGAVKRPLLALMTILAVAACGGSTPSAASPAPKVTFAMAAQNGSAVAGTADVVRSGASFTLTVKLTGLAFSSSHISHIHSGKCAAPGGVAFALQQLVADASGAATMTTLVPAGYAVPASGWY